MRVEQLYPWPEEPIVHLLDHYARADEVVWLQEEPETWAPGPWCHLPQLRVCCASALATASEPRGVGQPRPPAARRFHQLEQADLVGQGDRLSRCRVTPPRVGPRRGCLTSGHHGSLRTTWWSNRCGTWQPKEGRCPAWRSSTRPCAPTWKNNPNAEVIVVVGTFPSSIGSTRVSTKTARTGRAAW